MMKMTKMEHFILFFSLNGFKRTKEKPILELSERKISETFHDLQASFELNTVMQNYYV